MLKKTFSILMVAIIAAGALAISGGSAATRFTVTFSVSD
jgi:hypothetical protein